MLLESLPTEIIQDIARQLLWLDVRSEHNTLFENWTRIDCCTSLGAFTNTCRRFKRILEPDIYQVYAPYAYILNVKFSTRFPFRGYKVHDYAESLPLDPLLYAHNGPPIF